MSVDTAKRPEKKPIKTNKNKKNNLVKGYRLDRCRDHVRRARNGKKSRRDDGLQAGATPVLMVDTTMSPDGTTEPMRRVCRPFGTFVWWGP